MNTNEQPSKRETVESSGALPPLGVSPSAREGLPPLVRETGGAAGDSFGAQVLTYAKRLAHWAWELAKKGAKYAAIVWRQGYYELPEESPPTATPPPIPGASDDAEASKRPPLPRLVVWPIWKIPRKLQPQYLVKNQGDLLEPIVSAFIRAVVAEQSRSPELKLGWVSDADNAPGFARPLRVLNQIAAGHVATTDIMFLKQGGNLQVRFEGKAWTKISVLRHGLFFAAFLVLFFGLLGVLFVTTDIHASWAREYARKHAARDRSETSDNVSALQDAILTGGHPNAYAVFSTLQKMGHNPKSILDLIPNIPFYQPLKPQYSAIPADKASEALTNLLNSEGALYLGFSVLTGNEEWISALPRSERKMLKTVIANLSTPPPTKFQLFRADPVLFFTSVGAFPGILSLLVWGGLQFTPKSTVRRPCLKLGWPTPQLFQQKVEAHAVSMHALLSDVLKREFDIKGGDVVPMDSNSPS